MHRTSVDADTANNDPVYRLFMPDAEHPTRAEVEPAFASMNALPVAWVDPVDISDVVLFLASHEARCVTGTGLKVDAGHGLV